MVLLFIVLAIVGLSFIRNHIQRSIYAVVVLMGGSSRLGLVIYTLFFLPGIMVHELSHFFVASLLGVRTGDIELFPKGLGENSERIALGSVKVAKTDFVRESMIGVAPFIVGMAVMISLVSVFLAPLFPDTLLPPETMVAWWQASLGWRQLTAMYGVLMVANTLFASKEDARSWPAIVILGSVLGILGYFLKLSLSPALLVYSKLEPLVTTLAGMMVFVVLIDVVFLGILWLITTLLERITGKRVRFRS